MWFASPRTLILRGVVTIAFGLLLILWPAVSFRVFVFLFGAFALAEGALLVTGAVWSAPEADGRTAAFTAGSLGILVGVVTFFWPGLTLLAMLWLIALRAVIVGAAELSAATHLARQAAGGGATWLLGAAGVLSIAFGAVLVLFPGAGLVAVVWAIGLYAILLGAMLIGKAWLITRPVYAK